MAEDMLPHGSLEACYVSEIIGNTQLPAGINLQRGAVYFGQHVTTERTSDCYFVGQIIAAKSGQKLNTIFKLLILADSKMCSLPSEPTENGYVPSPEFKIIYKESLRGKLYKERLSEVVRVKLMAKGLYGGVTFVPRGNGGGFKQIRNEINQKAAKTHAETSESSQPNLGATADESSRGATTDKTNDAAATSPGINPLTTRTTLPSTRTSRHSTRTTQPSTRITRPSERTTQPYTRGTRPSTRTARPSTQNNGPPTTSSKRARSSGDTDPTPAKNSRFNMSKAYKNPLDIISDDEDDIAIMESEDGIASTQDAFNSSNGYYSKGMTQRKSSRDSNSISKGQSNSCDDDDAATHDVGARHKRARKANASIDVEPGNYEGLSRTHGLEIQPPVASRRKDRAPTLTSHSRLTPSMTILLQKGEVLPEAGNYNEFEMADTNDSLAHDDLAAQGPTTGAQPPKKRRLRLRTGRERTEMLKKASTSAFVAPQACTSFTDSPQRATDQQEEPDDAMENPAAQPDDARDTLAEYLALTGHDEPDSSMQDFGLAGNEQPNHTLSVSEAEEEADTDDYYSAYNSERRPHVSVKVGRKRACEAFRESIRKKEEDACQAMADELAASREEVERLRLENMLLKQEAPNYPDIGYNVRLNALARPLYEDQLAREMMRDEGQSEKSAVENAKRTCRMIFGPDTSKPPSERT